MYQAIKNKDGLKRQYQSHNNNHKKINLFFCKQRRVVKEEIIQVKNQRIFLDILTINLFIS
jgi:hypothetical protein